MSDGAHGDGAHGGVAEELDAAECLRLVAGQQIGRVAYNSRSGPMVLPVNYRLFEDSIVFRTAQGSAMDEDLTTGIADAEYLIAFEIDKLDPEPSGRLDRAHPRIGAPRHGRGRAIVGGPGRGDPVGRWCPGSVHADRASPTSAAPDHPPG